MGTQLSRFLGRAIALVCIGCLSMLIAACGGTSPSSTQPATQSTSSVTTVTVTITEQAGTHDIYGFSPKPVTVKAGQPILFNNQSDEFHLLMTADAAGHITADAVPFTATTIVPTSRAGSATTLQVVFNTPGTYYY